MLPPLPLPLSSTALSKEAWREKGTLPATTELIRLCVLLGDDNGTPSSSTSSVPDDSKGHPELKAALAKIALDGNVLARVSSEFSSIIKVSIVLVLTRSCNLFLLGSK